MFNDTLSRVFAAEWMLIAVAAALLIGCAELGFRFGFRLHERGDTARIAQIGGIQGAVLGLLGLLLGFTYAMAVNHYDSRRDLVLKEANAIGTTWLRAALLPEQHQRPVRDLLRRYVEVRLAYQKRADDPEALAEGLRLSAEIQAEIWGHATDAANQSPSAMTSLFIVSLTEIIDTDAERVAESRAKIPDGVWLLVFIVAGAGCFTTSYGAGSGGARTKLANVFLPVLLIVVIVLVFDFTHPRRGMIAVSQQPLVDVLRSFEAGAAMSGVRG